MRVVAIAAAAVLLAASAARADELDAEDCEHPQSTLEIDLCANDVLNKVDGELNAAYRELMRRYRPEDRVLLKDAELKWIAFRDAECAFETNANREGSGHFSLLIDCHTAKTRIRLKELRAQIDCTADDCNPPPR